MNNFIIDSPLKGAGFALFAYLLTFAISILVTGVILIVGRVIGMSNKKAADKPEATE